MQLNTAHTATSSSTVFDNHYNIVDQHNDSTLSEHVRQKVGVARSSFWKPASVDERGPFTRSWPILDFSIANFSRVSKLYYSDGASACLVQYTSHCRNNCTDTHHITFRISWDVVPDNRPTSLFPFENHH